MVISTFTNMVKHLFYVSTQSKLYIFEILLKFQLNYLISLILWKVLLKLSFMKKFSWNSGSFSNLFSKDFKRMIDRSLFKGRTGLSLSTIDQLNNGFPSSFLRCPQVLLQHFVQFLIKGLVSFWTCAKSFYFLKTSYGLR